MAIREHSSFRTARIAGACLVAFVFLSGCRSAGVPEPVSENADLREPAPPQASRAAREPGTYHRLEPGETLSQLSQSYQVPVSTLMQINGITDPSSIPAHTVLFIPGGARPRHSRTHANPPLAWPIRGKIMTSFNEAKGEGRRRHEGIDIDGVMGETIHAAAGGTVLEARADGRYGQSVLIDHGGGLETFYAHASKLLVQVGEKVEQGEPIAEVGRTGNATGPHLHFETRVEGHPVNPMRYLRNGAVLASAPR